MHKLDRLFALEVTLEVPSWNSVTFEIRFLNVTDQSQGFENLHNFFSLCFISMTLQFLVLVLKFTSKKIFFKISFLRFLVFEFESDLIDDGSANDGF